jgi:DNA-binding LacI/PurR family transcriptional regulator
VRQDSQAKGRAAAGLLVAAIEKHRDRDPTGGTNGHATRARHLVLPTELVVRDSTSAPRH